MQMQKYGLDWTEKRFGQVTNYITYFQKKINGNKIKKFNQTGTLNPLLLPIRNFDKNKNNTFESIRHGSIMPFLCCIDPLSKKDEFVF